MISKPRGAIVGGFRAARGILLPRRVVAVLLDQHDVSGDNGRNKMGLARTSLVDGAHPGVYPIVLALTETAASIILVRTVLTHRSEV
jgi:hypothetical protein